ncbi:DUF6520 family protein [Mucilaginibacter aquariorum]|uniref:DUF6520 family protein n=1 Tax=Mucilaginibacter aquariorum TaxID=2967225 RepID=A0ABT1SZI5_9SPHI|nr:DUF6520 family protein [Mucilaginibacter aquariorum]MCQ6957628.1 DUF6520 family protein [Mucilaginibacter aquariorum]
MKKLIIPVIAIIMAFGSSAFTTNKATSNFFKYVGPAARTISDVQSASNYQATAVNPCVELNDVCGITLPTARTIGLSPASSDFTPTVQGKLWSSQSNHQPFDGTISMEDAQ